MGIPCRFCHNPLTRVFADLGSSPLANHFLTRDELQQGERYYSLQVYLCDQCFLAQIPEVAAPENLFSEYPDLLSCSRSYLQQAKNYATQMTSKLLLTNYNLVIEIASNDGYLLQYFKDNKIPVLGIEPALNIAKIAKKKAIPTYSDFFSADFARVLLSEGKKADLLVANNVLANVPELNDFIKGMAIILKPQGLISFEVPHLLAMIADNQFDTIYHEHLYYFSFLVLEKILSRHQLKIIDVDELPTHGGSLRIYAGHFNHEGKIAFDKIQALREKEVDAGLADATSYMLFNNVIKKFRDEFSEFLKCKKAEGKRVAAYGAPAKGNTLLNYCNVTTDLIEYTVDVNHYKQYRYLPGTHIPIYEPHKIAETKPDVIIILPWNIQQEIREVLEYTQRWGAELYVPIPEVTRVL